MADHRQEFVVLFPKIVEKTEKLVGQKRAYCPEYVKLELI
ncbi:MAG: hypothetical protein UX81_C0015G0007 [Parcubacteria group bacterium GW2011_GWA2_47_12]|nr:MAG: hypothetical protein UX81_C0015G0007 [Parcubacteria group bacterium GW2011_GWA2_47_12]